MLTCVHPALISTNDKPPLTSTGTKLCAGTPTEPPTPSCELEFKPQHMAAPLDSTPQVLQRDVCERMDEKLLTALCYLVLVPLRQCCKPNSTHWAWPAEICVKEYAPTTCAGSKASLVEFKPVWPLRP